MQFPDRSSVPASADNVLASTRISPNPANSPIIDDYLKMRATRHLVDERKTPLALLKRVSDEVMSVDVPGLLADRGMPIECAFVVRGRRFDCAYSCQLEIDPYSRIGSALIVYAMDLPYRDREPKDYRRIGFTLYDQVFHFETEQGYELHQSGDMRIKGYPDDTPQDFDLPSEPGHPKRRLATRWGSAVIDAVLLKSPRGLMFDEFSSTVFPLFRPRHYQMGINPCDRGRKVFSRYSNSVAAGVSQHGRAAAFGLNSGDLEFVSKCIKRVSYIAGLPTKKWA